MNLKKESFLIIAFYFLFCTTNFVIADSNENTRAKSRIIVKALAADDYVRKYDINGNPLPEICSFYEGTYYPEEFSLEEDSIQFETVLKFLASELMNKNYIVNSDPKECEYVILVNWGFTKEKTLEDVLREEIVMGTYTDGDGEVIEEIAIFESDIGANKSKENAKLIGAESLKSMYAYSLRKKLLEEASDEKRLFIQLLAFSREVLSDDTKKPTPSWITILSIPYYDIKTEVALKSLSEVGGAYFGTDFDKPRFEDANKSEYIDTPDDIRYLGIDD